MSKHIDHGLEYEILNNEASLIGFASGSKLAIDNVPHMVIPEIVRGVPVTRIKEFAFEKVDELETVTIPSTLKEIDKCAFLGCQHLTQITMSCPRSKQDVLKIGPSAFAYCFSLNEFDVFCTLEIAERAFLACDNLTKLSGAITYVDISAFRDCNRIYILNLQHNASVKCDAFYGSTIENIRCLGDVAFFANDIRSIIDNGTNVLCYSDSKTADLAYLGVQVSCTNRS